MAVVVRAVLEPGSRLIVRYANDPVDHELIAGWQVDDGSWIVGTPHLTLAEEDTSLWTRVADVTGTDVYPDDVDEVMSFTRPLEDFEIADLVARARDEAKLVRESEGRDVPSRAPSVMRTWAGGYVALPAEGGVAALRRRVFGKRSNFDVGRRGHLRGTGGAELAPLVPALSFDGTLAAPAGAVLGGTHTAMTRAAAAECAAGGDG